MKITCNSLGDMLDIVHGLVQRGVQFEVTKDTTASAWVVQMTGGF